MDDRITVDLDRDLIAALAQRAESRGHTIDEEVRAIVKDSVAAPASHGDWVARARAIRAMTRAEFVQMADAIAAMTPKDVVQSDSVDLIREDRDR